MPTKAATDWGIEAPAEPSAQKRMVRIEVLRFPLILLVIYIHAATADVTYNTGKLSPDNDLVRTIKYIGSDLIGRVSVASLFFISGYLFFRDGIYDLNIYVRKLKSRINSLILPLVLWNILLFLLILSGQNLPATSIFFNSASKRLSEFSPFEIMDAILGLTRSPIAYQFWFIRDLILLAIFSPLVYLVARFAPLIGGFVILTLWGGSLWPFTIPDITAVACFYFGSMFALNTLPIFALDRYRAAVYGLYAASLVGSVLARDTLLDIPMIAVSRLTGIAAALCVSKEIVRHRRGTEWLLALAPASFFVFAAHEPFLIIVRKLAYRVLEITPGTSLVLYLTVPLFIATVTALSYFLMRRVAPRFTAIIAGGR